VIRLVIDDVHSVSLIEDEVGDAAQVRVVGLKVVNQTTGRGNADLHSTPVVFIHLFSMCVSF
jgi:hypothetical protein